MTKRYYWIKLKQDFYDNKEEIDFLMEQPSGSDYVVLYQMLCLKTINNDGGLFLQVGEAIVPYDVEKIVRLCKYFSRETVIRALNFYKQLGLIYKEESGKVYITDFDEIVGSESESAPRMRKHRHKKESGETSQCNAKTPSQCDVEKDIDKEIDIYTDTTRVFNTNLPTRAQAFCKKYGIAIDTHTRADVADMDFDKLDVAYSRSAKFLQKSPASKVLSFVVRNYKSIIEGKYEDMDGSLQPFVPDYSADKLNAAFEKRNEDL